MRIAEIKSWMKERQTFLLLVVAFFIGSFILDFAFGPRSVRVVNLYSAQSLAGQVDTIFNYTRGMPKLGLSSGDVLVLYLPAAGQEYIQAGDSVVKKAGTETLTAYRKSPAYTEVSVFSSGNDSSDAEGLLKRYRIPAGLSK
jgi:hypothetical protein